MKIFITAIFIAMGFIQTPLQACHGTIYACGTQEVLSIGSEFYENCSVGDQIEVVDSCHPAEQGHRFWLYEFNQR